MTLDLTPEQYHTPELLLAAASRASGIPPADITHVQILHRSLDLRRHPVYHTTLSVHTALDPYSPPDFDGHYLDCHASPSVVIVGAGPAGLFAALRALQLGLKPVIIERGQPVEQRRLDVALLARSRQVNPSSNWCFGEGGAGTFSDGKLYTRSTKRGNIRYVLERLVEHGADPSILIDTHAHIGTDKLSSVIANIRRTILDHGGEYHFSTQATDLILQSDGSSTRVVGVTDHLGNHHLGIAVILATGHSARDIYHLFASRQWLLEAKPFALGVRVEHPQSLINDIQYHSAGSQRRFLPPASYSLTTQVDGHGVFSFCMCPGGVIVPAATDLGQQVVNGMSNSLRNSPFANSGIAVTVSPTDLPQYASHGPLALLRFQEDVESTISAATGRGLAAPIQRLTDFCSSRVSTNNNPSNYLADTISLPIHQLLPPFVTRCLQQGFRQFDRSMRGFLTSQASILAVESRTSSPVRIPRDPFTLQHPQLHNLYPCGEGAGYAGGIVSSALDGLKALERIANYSISPL